MESLAADFVQFFGAVANFLFSVRAQGTRLCLPLILKIFLKFPHYDPTPFGSSWGNFYINLLVILI